MHDRTASLPSRGGCSHMLVVLDRPGVDHSCSPTLVAKFRAAGFPVEDIHVLPLGETASLVVRYRGNGRGGRPILLNAHMDVVAAKREDWRRDPFTRVEENGYFYGRGTYDDKLDLVTLASALLRLEAEGYAPRPAPATAWRCSSRARSRCCATCPAGYAPCRHRRRMRARSRRPATGGRTS